MEVKILHLYYDIMNLYGEYGNIRILEQHLKDQGFEVIVDKKTIGEAKNFEQYDFVYMGCGTERNQQVIMQDLMQEKESLKEFIEAEKPVVLTGNSYEILGKSIDDKEALGLFEFETTHNENRTTSDIICTSPIFKSKVVGFINTMSNVKNIENPLFTLEFGLEKGEIEGIHYKNLLGTHLIGPILERNPEILKYVIEKIATKKDENYKYKDIEYEDEEKGYELVVKELEARQALLEQQKK